MSRDVGNVADVINLRIKDSLGRSLDGFRWSRIEDFLWRLKVESRLVHMCNSVVVLRNRKRWEKWLWMFNV